MESAMLNRILKKFWEGQASELEERQLREASRSDQQDEEMDALMSYFAHSEARSKVTFPDVDLETVLRAEIKKKSKPVGKLSFYWRSVAASLLIAVSITGGLYWQRSQSAQVIEADTYTDAEMAFAEVKKAMMLLSNNLNEGMEHTSVLGEFHSATQTLDKKNK